MKKFIQTKKTNKHTIKKDSNKLTQHTSKQENTRTLTKRVG